MTKQELQIYINSKIQPIPKTEKLSLILLKTLIDHRNQHGQVLIPDALHAIRQLDLPGYRPIQDVNELWAEYKIEPLQGLNRNQIVSLIKKNDEKYYFQISHDLIASLTSQDWHELSNDIDKLLRSPVPSVSKPKYKGKPANRIVTPFERLKKRISKEFSLKPLLGDIVLNQDEYELLMKYFVDRCVALLQGRLSVQDDPLFAIALVHFGIRHYDGGYWNHLSAMLGMPLNANRTAKIRDLFTNTLIKHGKPLTDNPEHIQNIMMHGFISDKYADEMFDFFFKYYNLDLERDLARNTKEMMDNLIDIIGREDNTGRTHLLVRQTAYAVQSNIPAGKTRIRRLLRLIDKRFWENKIPSKPTSRLSILFNEWQERSEEFNKEIDYYQSGRGKARGRKGFSAPYLRCDMARTAFQIILPTQLIHAEGEPAVFWKVISESGEHCFGMGSRQAVTGWKTEQKEVSIGSDELFGTFQLELYCDDQRIRVFKIKADAIRFFDRFGDGVSPDSLPRGEVYSFTMPEDIPFSDAFQDSEKVGGLLRSWFEFENGDLVRLPDRKVVSVGNRIEEGLQARYLLDGASAVIGELKVSVFHQPPAMLLKIHQRRAAGSAIHVNGVRHRLFDYDFMTFDLQDRSGEQGYYLQLSDLGCTQDGFYQIHVDVPGDRTRRAWQFVLINGLQHAFEDAPYIFKPKGTIRFPEYLKLKSLGLTESKNQDENSFNFQIQPDARTLPFSYQTPSETLHLEFEIPVFQWRVGKEEWQTEKPEDLWYSKFQVQAQFRFPADKLTVELDDSDEGQELVFYRGKETGRFDCDLTKMLSWFGREHQSRSILLDFSGKRFEWRKVVTRSTVLSQSLTSNLEEGTLYGHIEITGEADYYVDVTHVDTDTHMADKLLLDNGSFTIHGSIKSGNYQITVYEAETDDSGFGMLQYLPVKTINYGVVDPFDLNGKKVRLRYFKTSIDSMFQNSFGTNYVIDQLERVENQNQQYRGRMFLGLKEVEVNVEFLDLKDLKYAYLTFFDGDDFVEFLYDTNTKNLAKSELHTLSKAECYRRYLSLFPEDYVYIIEFTEDNQNNMRKNGYGDDYNHSYNNRREYE